MNTIAIDQDRFLNEFQSFLEERTVDFQRLLPEYKGFEFWLNRLDNAGMGETHARYGYTIRSAHHIEGGGSYDSKHAATCAAFARIETLTFNR
jgi:hypothetical protein